MKNTIKYFSLAAFALFLLFFPGCSDYLEDPLKDKETGEDINLLIVDFNFFDTRMSFKLLDAETGMSITEQAIIRFTGKNSSDIVNFAGEKKPEYVTSKGQREVTVDPNVAFSESSPFEFAVHVEVPGYNAFSKGIQLRNKGKKTIELKLSKVSDGDETDLTGEIDTTDGDTTIVFSMMNLKSAAVEDKPYKINYSITIQDFLKFKDSDGHYLFSSSTEVMEAYNSDPENFIVMSINSYSEYEPGVDVINKDGVDVSVLFHKLETGSCTKLLVTGRTVADLNGGVIKSTCSYTGDAAPDIFGFAEFGIASWNILGTTNIYETPYFSYTLVEASTAPLCETGSEITFRSNAVSSFSIDADVYDMEGNLINTINFKGDFPETFVMENTPNEAVKMVFRNNNASFEEIPSLHIDNFCSGSYNVDVTQETGYVEYQIVLRAICPDNPTVAIAPTYSAEIKAKNSNDPWQGVDMVGGVVNLLGLPNQEYELRLLWEDEWEYSTYWTEFDENGNYLHETSDRAKISSKVLEDGRIQINVEQKFSQDVCNDVNW